MELLLLPLVVGIIVGAIERMNYSTASAIEGILWILIFGASIVTMFADNLWHGILLFFALGIPFFVGYLITSLPESVIRHGSRKWTLRCTKCGCRKLHIDKEEDCVIVCSCPKCGDRNQVHMLTVN